MPGSEGKGLEAAAPRDHICAHRAPEGSGSNAEVLKQVGSREASEAQQST